jgi:streptogramin lyase
MTGREQINEATGGVLRRERPQALRLSALMFAVVAGLAILLGAILSAAQAAPSPFKYKEYKVPTADSAPSWITAGSDGNLWFTESDPEFNEETLTDIGKVAQITPAGDITEFAVCESCFPNEIVQGPDGILYFTKNDAPLGRITTDGQVLPDAGERFSFNGDGIARHGDDIWINDFNNDSLWRYNVTSGNFTQFEEPNNPSDVAVDANGIVWYTANSPNAIGRLNPADGAITETPVPAQPWQIAIATDGKVWYTERIADHIGRLDPSNDQLTRFPTLTPGAGPHGITAGPDGSMWFTQANTGNAAQITADGTITEAGKTSKTPAGTLENALGITMGPDGQSVWFAKPADNVIAALTQK